MKDKILPILFVLLFMILNSCASSAATKQAFIGSSLISKDERIPGFAYYRSNDAETLLGGISLYIDPNNEKRVFIKSIDWSDDRLTQLKDKDANAFAQRITHTREERFLINIDLLFLPEPLKIEKNFWGLNTKSGLYFGSGWGLEILAISRETVINYEYQYEGAEKSETIDLPDRFSIKTDPAFYLTLGFFSKIGGEFGGLEVYLGGQTLPLEKDSEKNRLALAGGIGFRF